MNYSLETILTSPVVQFVFAVLFVSLWGTALSGILGVEFPMLRKILKSISSWWAHTRD